MTVCESLISQVVILWCRLPQMWVLSANQGLAQVHFPTSTDSGFVAFIPICSSLSSLCPLLTPSSSILLYCMLILELLILLDCPIVPSSWLTLVLYMWIPTPGDLRYLFSWNPLRLLYTWWIHWTPWHLTQDWELPLNIWVLKIIKMINCLAKPGNLMWAFCFNFRISVLFFLVLVRFFFVCFLM